MKLSCGATSLFFAASVWAQPAPRQGPKSSNGAVSVSEITVERKGCFGGCPIYTLTLRREGSSIYIGKTGPRRGLYTTKLLWSGYFDQLSKAISDVRFFDLPDETRLIEDAEQVIVTVTTPLQSKTVKTLDFATAPFALWAAVTLADGMAANLSWENLNQPKFGILGPVPIRRVQAEYTEEARKARLEGSVIVQVEVRPDGTVTPDSIAVVQGLGMGLDEKAIEAVKQWVFKPAYKDGKPMGISMPVSVQVEFRL